jgi:hypothetical protein
MSIAVLAPPDPVPACASGRRLADRRREPRSPQRSLVVDNGCDVRAGHARLEPGTVLALLSWLPLTDGDLVPVESERETLDPVAAVALVLRPPTIWSPLEALAARGRPLDPSGLRELVTPLHIRRLRRAAARIAAQLPVSRLPQASVLVAEGCGVVARDPEACVDVAAAQLVRYVTSDLIRRL